jgi:HEAT repeat protein
MRFDPLSFLLGFGSASGIGFAIWRYRMRLAAFRESAEAQVEGTREFIGRTAEARYARDIIQYAQGYHLAGDLFKLTDLLLEPRLILPPDPLAPPSANDVPDANVFDVIPLCHDMPFSYAPYNLETLPLENLGAGERHVAILGIQGIGKSTTLATLALMALGEVSFETIEDLTERAISEEEEGLTDDERRDRQREREAIQMRAMEKLHDVHQQQRKQFGQSADDKLTARSIAGLVPVMVHLNDVDLNPEAYGGRNTPLDPAEPLVRAVQRRVSAVTSQVVGSVVYPALERGQALILIDGYDELAPTVRETYFYWLRNLIDMHGDNLIVITGPATGYDPLLTLGFTPVFLRAWSQEDFTTLAEHWATAWPTQSKGRRKVAAPDQQTQRRISIDNRGRTILDVTFKIWTGLADDARDTGRVGWYDAFINRKLADADKRDLLPALAVPILESGFVASQDVLNEAIRDWLPKPAEGDKAPKTEGILESIVQDGLLVAHPGGRYRFIHPQITSYLASEAIVEAGPEQAADLALDPLWKAALAFAAARVDMTPALQRKLQHAPDLLFSPLFDIVRWLPDAPSDAHWRGDLFKRLAAALMAPEQFPTVRERAMAALIAARDKNVLFILRQALRAADPTIRRLACVGLGALGNAEAVKDLAPMLVDDERDVQLASGLALGAIGTERALETMVHGLIDGSEELRQAVAEALAAIPGEGHAILRDGVESDDIMIRRACVYGLSRIKAPWALITLYRTMMEDHQWYVRTAAEEAFMTAQSPERPGPRLHPEADSLLWLVEWAAERGEGVPAGPNARQVLIRALQEAPPDRQSLAATTLARLGHVPAITALYNALRDRTPEVRSAAYDALADLQMQLGEPLPGLV